MERKNLFTLTCPVPISKYPKVLLSHGGGGRLMHQLIEKMFVQTFQNSFMQARHDGAVFELNKAKLAFTTDSYVVHPIIFPGGDIGALAVNGTVNDLAMCGARPLYLSAGFILEEGLDMEILWQVVQSMNQAAVDANVQLITGDTKVVDKGKGDGIFINTAGVGIIEHDLNIEPRSVQPGDIVLLSGDIGRHGIAIMAVREGLTFESSIESDTAPLTNIVLALLNEGIEIHCMRDLTRGGLASALNEIAEVAGVEITINESEIPVREDVQGACETLGLDPLYVANEGRFIVFVPKSFAERALSIFRLFQPDTNAVVIGEVLSRSHGTVTMKTKIGVTRIVDMLSGEQLPRIC
jgi:hydrogenase expression/formation protein HypE